MAKAVTAQDVQDLHTKVQNGLIDVTKKSKWQAWADMPRSKLTQRQRTIVALGSDLYDYDACELAVHLLRCVPNEQPCGIVFCPHCRQLAQNDMSRRLLQHFEHTPRNQLRFLTLLCELSYDPCYELPAKRRKLKRSIDTALQALSPTPRVYGAYELDVKHPDYACAHRSREVLDELGMRFDGKKQNAYLLHLHAVVDLNGGSADTFKKRLKERFPGRWRVFAVNFWTTRSVEENLYVLGQYMTKTRLQYSDNLYGSSLSGKARYMTFYPDHVIREVADTLKLLHGNRRYAKYSYNV